MQEQHARYQPDRDDVSDSATAGLWALIEPRPLMREALIGMMVAGGTQPMVGAASADDLVSRISETDGRRLSLVIFHLLGDPVETEPLRDACSLLRSRFGEVPVVLLSDRIDLNEVGCAFRAGARGCISTSSSCPAALRALRQVEAGNIYVPEEILSGFLNTTALEGPPGLARQPTAASRTFTPRQLQVLTLLREGKPNKIIAHQLQMQESTVKVHVREIMKKLKVTNRTEAAFRAGQLLTNLKDHTSQENAASSGSAR